ncbi:MAG: YigZ family protein [Bacilli bacterium]
MKTIENNIENTIIIDKSKFITILYRVQTEENVKKKLKEIKKKYKNANHYCYGYIIDNIKKASDDGEPNGTAGIPILNILENNDLNNILCIVVRYFGGIKLGTGGLIRAYSNSIKKALQKTKLKIIIKGIIIQISFDYENEKKVLHIINNNHVKSKIYSNKITYEIAVPLEKIENIKNQLEIINVKIKEKDNVSIEI